MKRLINRKVLVIGSANIDFLLKTPRVPVSGETVVADGSYCFVAGGKGANAAIAAARLGADVTLCTKVGDDAYGDRLLEIYRENGISLGCIGIDKKRQTGLAVVMLERNGANRTIVYQGANASVSNDDVDAALATRPDIVLTNCEIPASTVAYISKRCEETQTPLVVDFGGANTNFPLSTLGKIEIASPNEQETFNLTGVNPNTLDDCMRAAIKLMSLVKCKYVVLKLGSRGSYIYDGKYCRVCMPYQVDAVDTTAAGDAFTAAMTHLYINGGDIVSACNFANAVGALTVSKVGAINSLPTKDEVEEFIKTAQTV